MGKLRFYVLTLIQATDSISPAVRDFLEVTTPTGSQTNRQIALKSAIQARTERQQIVYNAVLTLDLPRRSGPRFAMAN